MITGGSGDHLSLIAVEASLTLCSIAIAFAWPGLGQRQFLAVERTIRALAGRKALAIIIVGASAIGLRLALLPWNPIPLPVIPDDFSFLLAGNTFASGRLTNPTPEMWIHFESIFIDIKPTYMSMYFPGEGLVLAAGKVLFGHPWFGLLLVNGLMCAALCWMLQAWLPPCWALFGGLIAVLRISLFSYWINSYTGGGAIAALGGALVLGALPRLEKSWLWKQGLLMAIGMVLLAYTRPFEGVLLCVPVLIAMIWRYKTDRDSPNLARLAQNALPGLMVLLIGAIWLGYYDYRAYGSPFTLPYSVNRAAYAVDPYFVWQTPRAEPVYRHEMIRKFYVSDEQDIYRKLHSLPGFLIGTPDKILILIEFFAGFALIPPLCMMRRVILDRRVRFLLLLLLISFTGIVIQTFFVQHYVAPFTAVYYALGLQATRHLWIWKAGGQDVGRAMVRLLVCVCLLMVVPRLLNRLLGMPVPAYPTEKWACWWYGPDWHGTERAAVAAELSRLPGNQLAIVRYAPGHDPLNEWVYNEPNIDTSKVIWARDMGVALDRDLVRHYSARSVWLVQPDTAPVSVTPYPAVR
ncbi:MAG TPA: hypothetical protein VFI20_00925 [Terracidiphilus sp.]|nr:hypothetical protein [Terracidiphilus sp.]